MSTAEACNTIPAVVVEGYVEKGTWIELGGLKTYATGSQTSTKAIIDIYDIFGPAPQTLQGADLLASALHVLVIVPDFFRGSPAQNEWYSVQSEENEKKKTEFMGTARNFGAHAKTLLGLVEAAKEKWGSVESWGAFGLCWGGKVTALTSGANTPFKVSGQVHPGGFSKDDAGKITIPHIVLASKGEDAAVTKAYEEIFAGEGKIGEIETYGTMHHGWMGARADLKNEENLKEYERGYNHLAKFFAKYL